MFDFLRPLDHRCKLHNNPGQIKTYTYKLILNFFFRHTKKLNKHSTFEKLEFFMNLLMIQALGG